MENMNETTVSQFKKLFRGRETVHGRYGFKADGSKDAKTVREPVPDEVWETHLRGDGPFLGMVPTRLDHQCYFAALDVDDDQIDHTALAHKVELLELPLIVCRSKSGGAHLYVFFVEPVPATIVTEKLLLWRQQLGLGNPDGRPVEIFPKQVKPKKTDVGNWINLPYYGGDETNRYAIQEGGHLTLSEFLVAAMHKSVTQAELEAIGLDTDEGLFKDGPPCLLALHKLGYGEGERNLGMYNVICFLKIRYPDDWQDRAKDYNNDSIEPPLPNTEITDLITSLEKRDYLYKCKEPPISSVCNKAHCKKRTYGIGYFTQQGINEAFPEIEQLIIVETDPPTWYIKVNGTTLELTSEELTQLVKFRIKCMEKLICVVPQITVNQYMDRLRPLLAEAVRIEAPPDAGMFGQFTVLLDDFLDQRRYNEMGREELLLGKPHEEDAKILFRSQDLLRFLQYQGYRAYTSRETYNALKRLGGDSCQVRLKDGKQLRVWSVPVERVTTQGELPVPEQREEPEF